MFQDSIRTCATSNYLSELDVVLNVHGRDTSTVKPVDVRHSDVIFSGVSETGFEASLFQMVSVSLELSHQDIHVTFVDKSAAVSLEKMSWHQRGRMRLKRAWSRHLLS
jgi:hypothetical protein